MTVQNLRPQGGQLKGGKGLRGSDKHQEGLRDERHGAHDSAATPIETLPMQQLSTPHEATQTGADNLYPGRYGVSAAAHLVSVCKKIMERVKAVSAIRGTSRKKSEGEARSGERHYEPRCDVPAYDEIRTVVIWREKR